MYKVFVYSQRAVEESERYFQYNLDLELRINQGLILRYQLKTADFRVTNLENAR